MQLKLLALNNNIFSSTSCACSHSCHITIPNALLTKPVPIRIRYEKTLFVPNLVIPMFIIAV